MKLLFNALLILSCLAIGFAAAKIYSIPYFSIKNELDPIALFSALVSVLVLYFLYTFIDKDKEDRVREKDLILGRIEEIYQLIKSQSFEFGSSSIEYSTAAANTKRVRVLLLSIEDLLKEVGVNHHKKELDSILLEIRKLNNLLTYYRPPETGEIMHDYIPDIVVRDNIAHYSTNRLKQINSSYDKLKTQVLAYQLKINRA
ncbi:hypothetical protein [Salegentibacter salarius]|uniref:Uncharacterized protein n=1 Tax=Salegentibacter salarius TaxID=435906 RepID=A0A2N0TRH6_9FLAO|nr:hypothetical protein [Salegentibacter salarius]OEY71750.1 hypothetical protein BHS39_03535 [Salegentibacter salarius]PKD17343.1 hypothetical protein APR40_03535 [Salegentibacter salarius]SLJ89461.1 hypothetical protein SAMN05660445_00823 [Salegentibacter salarius]